MKQIVTLRVNARVRDVSIEPQQTVLEVLREELGLTGAKNGCNHGVCGACTILVDGKPVRGCLTLAIATTHSEITTVEGLGEAGIPTGVQEAMAEAGAFQCGFCASGFMIAIHWLLRHNPAPDVDEIRAALSGNLCRCSGYKQIIDAVLEAAKREAA